MHTLTPTLTKFPIAPANPTSFQYRRLCAALLVVLASLATGCSNEDEKIESTVSSNAIARVGDESITRRELITAQPGTTAAARSESLEGIINGRLLAQEARRRAIHKTPSLADKIESIRLEAEDRERELLRNALYAVVRAELPAPEDELRSHYEATKGRYAERQLVLARTSFQSRDAASKALIEGSKAPAAERLGPLPLARFPVSVLPEAARLRKVGDRGLVEGDDGEFSVIEIVEILAAEPRAFEDVREEVEKNYRVRNGSQAFRELLVDLRGKTQVTIDQEALQDAENWK